MEYEESKELLIAALHSMSFGKGSKKALILWGNKSFTPEELAKEIEDETEVGKEHIELHIGAMKWIEESEKNQPPKKKFWCKFWK